MHVIYITNISFLHTEQLTWNMEQIIYTDAGNEWEQWEQIQWHKMSYSFGNEWQWGEWMTMRGMNDNEGNEWQWGEWMVTRETCTGTNHISQNDLELLRHDVKMIRKG